MTFVARSSPTSSRVSTFAAIRTYNYRVYAIGQMVSVAGNWMQNIAIAWVTLQLSHSGTVLGIVTGARFLPMLLAGPWGGLVADRVNNRRLLIATQAGMAIVSLVLMAASWAGTITVPVLVGLVLALGCVNVFDGPSRQSFIPQLVDRRLLINAIALNSVGINAAKMIGPAVGGGVIAAVGITPCFLANALSFLAVIASLLLLRSSELYPVERAVPGKRQIREGLHYIAATPTLLFPLVMVVVTGVLTWEFPVTLPLITTQTFHRGAAEFGAAMAFMGVGAICGGVIAARRSRITVRSLAISALLWGTVIILAALMPVLPALFVILVFVGSGSITFNSSAKTLLQVEAAPQMRGRVMSLWSIAWQGGAVVGAPIVGAVGAHLGARYALGLSGLAAAIVGIAILALHQHSSASETADAADTRPPNSPRARLPLLRPASRVTLSIHNKLMKSAGSS